MVEKRAFKRVAPSTVSKRPVVRDEDGDEDEDRPVMRAPTHNPLADDSEIRGGWGASQEVIDSTSSFAQSFKPDTKMQVIKFIQPSPYAAFRRHWVDRVGGRRAYTCFQSAGKDCPLCAVGDKAVAVTAFNIGVLSDDGIPALKSWDTGVRITNQLKAFSNEPKIGPLHKPSIYFSVLKTEGTKRQQSTVIISPVRERDLVEDHNLQPLDEDAVKRLLEKAYTPDVIAFNTKREMEEIAAEMIGEDEPGTKAWGSE